ncbi:LysM peptidoglycan-binding domain-containing protein [Weissella paramesenteroides]|uniref:LysM peptidoglycan-binding domain-containing protein n=2 Tax=Weissella TaxID=46255 RepID=UPI0023A97C01|nr:LysM peptidoglycan-binding domain-containing protein [Weissella paramesenteroides]WEA52557.1 LysM peptidoglycan-binding domain-containing protein [Weissella paramesenteroides]
MHASVKNTLLATAGAAAALAGSSVVASADSITVKSGDTLYALAAAHHVTVDELVSANKIANANLILTGQKIELPGSSATSAQSTASSAATKPAAKGTSYTVKSGDTLWAIANANGLTLSELLSANQGLQASSIIYVGDSINLTASATQASSAPVASSAAATSTANASLAAASSAAAQSAATSAANASLAAASSAAAQSAANASLAAANSAAAQSAATSAANASLAAASSAAAQSAATSAANASLAAANSAAAQSAATSAANASLAAANSAAAQSAATSAANASLAAASSAAAQSAATSAANASLAAASSAAAQSAATSAANASLAAASSAAAQPQKVATSTASNNVVSADTTGNTYPYGQCTWYVKGDLSWVGNHWGNASAWPSSATAAGHTVNSTASVGAVAYFAPGVGGASAYGHVAVVDSVNSDGTITISEANYAGKLYNSRTISLSSVSGFIHQ